MVNSELVRAIKARIGSEGLLSHLWNLPPIGAVVVTPEAEVLCMNLSARMALLGSTELCAEGMSFRTICNDDIGAEVAEHAQIVLKSEMLHLVRVMRDGQAFEVTLVPYRCSQTETPCVLLIARPGHTPAADLDPSTPMLESRYFGLGPLDVLSAREIEVLALLREPLTVCQIAAQLHRAPKTVDNHVQSIREKLGVATRLEMVRVADRADLRITHASAVRYRERRPSFRSAALASA